MDPVPCIQRDRRMCGNVRISRDWCISVTVNTSVLTPDWLVVDVLILHSGP